MGSFAAVDAKAAPHKNGKDEVQLSEWQERKLKETKDPKERDRLRRKFVEIQQKKVADEKAAAKKDEPAAKPEAKKAKEEIAATVDVHPAQQTVDVKAPNIHLNLPAPHVNVNHGGLSYSYVLSRGWGWLQAFAIGAATWALIGGSVLRAFGHY